MHWLSFTKVEKVMLKLQNGWIWTVQRCGRSWRSSRRPETPLTDQDADENGVSAPVNYVKRKLQRNSLRSCRTLATAASVSKSTMHQVLRDNLGVKPFKMLHRQEFTANHVAMKILHAWDNVAKPTVLTWDNVTKPTVQTWYNNAKPTVHIL